MVSLVLVDIEVVRATPSHRTVSSCQESVIDVSLLDTRSQPFAPTKNLGRKEGSWWENPRLLPTLNLDWRFCAETTEGGLVTYRSAPRLGATAEPTGTRMLTCLLPARCIGVEAV